MRVSQLLNPTLREVPAEAEIVSHQLMLRAGFIRKVAGGVYTYLPLALRVLKKIEKIIREEMDAKGGQELMLPIVQPSELWKETKRWDVYGPECSGLKTDMTVNFALGRRMKR
jgi:prolyl-tRNA synthetase